MSRERHSTSSHLNVRPPVCCVTVRACVYSKLEHQDLCRITRETVWCMSMCAPWSVRSAHCGPWIGSEIRIARASKRRTHNYSKKRKKYTAKMRHKHGHNHKLHVLPIPHAERESAELDSGNGRGNLTPPLTPLSQHCGFDSPDLLGRVGLESVRSYRHCHLSCRRRPVSPFGPSRACRVNTHCGARLPVRLCAVRVCPCVRGCICV